MRQLFSRTVDADERRIESRRLESQKRIIVATRLFDYKKAWRKTLQEKLLQLTRIGSNRGSKFLANQMVDGGFVALFPALLCAFLTEAEQTRASLPPSSA
jgi:hypothetical protein